MSFFKSFFPDTSILPIFRSLALPPWLPTNWTLQWEHQNTVCDEIWTESFSAVCNITGGHRPISVQSFILAAQWCTRTVLVANRYFWKGGWRSKSSLQLSLLLCWLWRVLEVHLRVHWALYFGVGQWSQKRSVTYATFQKWCRDFDRELQTLSWLDCNTIYKDGKKIVTHLKC